VQNIFKIESVIWSRIGSRKATEDDLVHCFTFFCLLLMIDDAKVMWIMCVCRRIVT
jgi:hypothetical protein